MRWSTRRAVTRALGMLVAAILLAAVSNQTNAKGDGRPTLDTQSKPAPSETLATFASYPATRPVPNRARRRLEAENKRFDKNGWMDAVTEVRPDGTFAFDIVDEGGSGIIRGRVLRGALEAEAAAVRDDPAKSGFIPDNYSITDLGMTDEGLVKLGLTPKREDRLLLQGFALVTPGDARLVRVEGRLAKNPSFWTTRVDIVRRYKEVAGYRLLAEIESTAQIRIVGTSGFRMQIRYETVEGQPLPAEDPGEQAESPARSISSAPVSRPKLVR